MARKAKIEIQNTDRDGNQTEVSKKITPTQAARAMKASGAKAPRSVFAGGRGRRPNAMGGRGPKGAGRGQNGAVSCFARGRPQDGSGPLGGTAACPNS